MTNVPGVGSEANRLEGVKVILLGPDCSGKSTIAKHLAEKLGVSARGNRRIKDELDAADFVLDFVREEVRDKQKTFVLDQFMYPVDIVYNATMFGEPSIMGLVEPIILPYIQEANVLFLHVDAQEAELKRRYDIRGDELWSFPEIARVARAYRNYFAGKKKVLAYRHLDTTELSIEEASDAAWQIVQKYFEEVTV